MSSALDECVSDPFRMSKYHPRKHRYYRPSNNKYSTSFDGNTSDEDMSGED